MICGTKLSPLPKVDTRLCGIYNKEQLILMIIITYSFQCYREKNTIVQNLGLLINTRKCSM